MNSISVYDYLNEDVLFYFSSHNSSICSTLLTIDTTMRAIALKCLSQATLQITRALPSLKTVDTENFTDDKIVKVFMIIINRLHDEAERLDCNQSYLDQDQALNRLAWELMHYPALMEKVQEQINVHQEKTFNTFVEKIAEQMEMSIPDDMDRRAYWNSVLKDSEGLKQITNLDLSECQLKFLPSEIFCLSNLEELNLSLNQLVELPTEIGMLSNLKHLYLNSNQIKKLPAEMTALSSLILLNLNHNKLHKIPEMLADLPNLRHLRMTHNNLQDLPSNFGLFSHLEYLNLSDNPLGNILEKISDLQHLTSLHLDNIQLKEISNSVTALTNLKTLSLGNNQLTKIDLEFISSLPRLETLFLRKNALDEETTLKLEELDKPFKTNIEFDPLPGRDYID